MRARCDIPAKCGGCNGCCDDFWTAFCCAPCGMAQMLHHLGVTSDKYKLCSETGTKEAEKDLLREDPGREL